MTVSRSTRCEPYWRAPPFEANPNRNPDPNSTFSWSNFIPLLKQTDRNHKVVKVLIGIDDGDATWVNAADLGKEVIAICESAHPKYHPKLRLLQTI